MHEYPNLLNILLVDLPVSMECSIQLSRSSRAEDLNYGCLIGTDPAITCFIEQPGIFVRQGVITNRIFLPRVSDVCHQKLQQHIIKKRNFSVLWSHLPFQLHYFPPLILLKEGKSRQFIWPYHANRNTKSSETEWFGVNMLNRMNIPSYSHHLYPKQCPHGGSAYTLKCKLAVLLLTVMWCESKWFRSRQCPLYPILGEHPSGLLHLFRLVPTSKEQLLSVCITNNTSDICLNRDNIWQHDKDNV